MGISIVRFQQSGPGSQWGVFDGNVEQDEITVLTSAYASHRELMDAWFSHPGELTSEGLTRICVKETNLLAPVTQDIQTFCQGLDYASHQEEGGMLLMGTPGGVIDRLRDFGTQNNEVRNAT